MPIHFLNTTDLKCPFFVQIPAISLNIPTTIVTGIDNV